MHKSLKIKQTQLNWLKNSFIHRTDPTKSFHWERRLNEGKMTENKGQFCKIIKMQRISRQILFWGHLSLFLCSIKSKLHLSFSSHDDWIVQLYKSYINQIIKNNNQWSHEMSIGWNFILCEANYKIQLLKWLLFWNVNYTNCFHLRKSHLSSLYCLPNPLGLYRLIEMELIKDLKYLPAFL